MAGGQRLNKEVKIIKISMKEKMLTYEKVLIRSLVKPSARKKQKTTRKKGILRAFFKKTRHCQKPPKKPLNCQRKLQGFAEIYTYL